MREPTKQTCEEEYPRIDVKPKKSLEIISMYSEEEVKSLCSEEEARKQYPCIQYTEEEIRTKYPCKYVEDGYNTKICLPGYRTIAPKK